MSAPVKPIEVSNSIIKDLADVKTNIQGLIEKLSTVQLEAMKEGMDAIADGLGKPFGAASKCAEDLQALIHDAELERNRRMDEAG